MREPRSGRSSVKWACTTNRPGLSKQCFPRSEATNKLTQEASESRRKLSTY